MSDAVRKRTIADFVVKTKKQVVKLYVVAKWARDAGAVLKAMVRMEPSGHVCTDLCHSRT